MAKWRLTLQRDSSIADSSALSLSFFRKPWKNRHGLEVKCAATYFTPLSAFRAHALSLFRSLSLFLPSWSSKPSKAQRRQRQRLSIVNKITVKENSLVIDPVILPHCNSTLPTWWHQTSFETRASVSVEKVLEVIYTFESMLLHASVYHGPPTASLIDILRELCHEAWLARCLFICNL